MKVEVRPPDRFPNNFRIILEAAIEVAAPQGDDRVGAADSPENAGLFQAATDYGFAAGFDHAWPDELVPAAELG